MCPAVEPRPVSRKETPAGRQAGRGHFFGRDRGRFKAKLMHGNHGLNNP